MAVGGARCAVQDQIDAVRLDSKWERAKTSML